jgi:hypothetical protein
MNDVAYEAILSFFSSVLSCIAEHIVDVHEDNENEGEEGDVVDAAVGRKPFHNFSLFIEIHFLNEIWDFVNEKSEF